MCGIISYVGSKNAAEKLIFGLKRLEYRGYDSAGVAIECKEGTRVIKSVGKVEELAEKLDEIKPKGACGIGHTRWATHGKVCEKNAHPHISQNKSVAIVHNGIIENAEELKEQLKGVGYEFYGDTDSEVIAAMIEQNFEGDPLMAIKRTVKSLKGSFAVAAMFEGATHKVYGFCRKSPLVLAETSDGSYFASDVLAIENATEFFEVEDGEIAEISEKGGCFYDSTLSKIGKRPEKIEKSRMEADKKGFSHYMRKEIEDEPEAIKRTLKEYDIERFDMEKYKLSDFTLWRLKKIYVAACGSAYHAGLYFKNIAEKLAKIPVEVMIASEVTDLTLMTAKNAIFVAISQSGETADTLQATRIAKAHGIKTVGIVNVKGSKLAREVDTVLPTNAGREIAVATTKAYTAQCVALFTLAVAIGRAKGNIAKGEIKDYGDALKGLSDNITEVIKKEPEIADLAKNLRKKRKFFFIGRGEDYALSLEAALKLKEITYRHAEGYPSGELKHGTISLVDKNTVCFATTTQQKYAQKTASNASETNARGAKTITLLTEDLSPIYSSSLTANEIQRNNDNTPENHTSNNDSSIVSRLENNYTETTTSNPTTIPSSKNSEVKLEAIKNSEASQKNYARTQRNNTDIPENLTSNTNYLRDTTATCKHKNFIPSTFVLPSTKGELSPILAATFYQLFAYHLAVLDGKDVDRPKNLAKSVTVE